MDITRQQHQLHRGYARAYSETSNDTDLVFFDVNGNRQSLQSTHSLSVETDLYETLCTEPNQIEKWFSQKERLWTDSLKAAREDQPLTSDDYCNLIEFALLTALRQKETIAVYDGIYKCFAEDNGGDIFKQSFGSLSQYMGSEWLNQNPVLAVISIGETENNCFYLTSDNPVVFFDENRRHQSLWTVPLCTFNGFFFPVSSTRLFISYLGEGFPELFADNNQLQRVQARKAIFTDRSKEDFLVAECSVPIRRPQIGIDLYLLNQNIIMEDGTKLPVKAIILSTEDEIWLCPDSGPRSGQSYRVYSV